jgi:hypothetical protein
LGLFWAFVRCRRQRTAPWKYLHWLIVLKCDTSCQKRE